MYCRIGLTIRVITSSENVSVRFLVCDSMQSAREESIERAPISVAWDTAKGRPKKGLKLLNPRDARRAQFGPNEKASAEKRVRKSERERQRHEIFMVCLWGPSVTLTLSKCNNIYIRAQLKEGRACRRAGVSEMLRPLYRWAVSW